MSLFSRKQKPGPLLSPIVNTAPEGPILAVESMRPRIPSESERARDLLREAQAQHDAFAAEALARGLSVEETGAAAAKAINSGILPRIFQGGLTFRNAMSPIPVVILHGRVPADALYVDTGSKHVPPSLSTAYLGSLPASEGFPDGPAPDDFYAEEREIPNTQTPSVEGLAGTVALMQTLRIETTEHDQT